MGIILGGTKFLATFVCAFSNNFAATQAFNFEQVREGGRPKSGDVVLVKSQVLKSVQEARKKILPVQKFDFFTFITQHFSQIHCHTAQGKLKNGTMIDDYPTLVFRVGEYEVGRHQLTCWN